MCIQVERDMNVVRDLNLTLVAAINTHAHADHITGTGLIKARPGWNADKAKTMISASSGAAADATFTHGDLIKFGSRFLSVRAVPGHTAGCVAFVLDDESLVMTGDALLIRGCGRTDFQVCYCLLGSCTFASCAIHSLLLATNLPTRHWQVNAC